MKELEKHLGAETVAELQHLRYDYISSLKISQYHGRSCVLLLQKEGKLFTMKISKFSLQNEYLVQSRLDHELIVSPITRGKLMNSNFILTSYCAGGTLTKYIKDTRGFGEQDAKVLFRQLVSVLDHLHKNQVAHLDLKPDNLVMTEENTINVIDFGHARSGSNALAVNSNRNGTIQTNSPERFTGKNFDGFSADIYSAGVILFFMVYKTYPFSSASPSCQFFKQFLEDRKLFLKNIYAISSELFGLEQAQLSQELLDLIDLMLEPDPLLRAGIDQIKSHEWLK